jgi:hypothetical protein
MSPPGGHRHPAEGQDPLSEQDDLVLALGLTGEDLVEAPVDPEVLEGPADAVGGQVEQAHGLVVDQCDPAPGVEADHPLPDPVQHRVPVLGQPGDGPGLKAEGLPLDPPGQQQRPGHAEGAGHPKVGEQVGDGGLEAVPDARGVGADDHEAHRPALAVQDRGVGGH